MNGLWGGPVGGVFEQMNRPSGGGGPTKGQTSCAGGLEGELERVVGIGSPLQNDERMVGRARGGSVRTNGQTFWREGPTNGQTSCAGGAKPTKGQTYWTKTGKGRPRGQAFWREGIGSGAGWKTGIGLRVWVYGERDTGISGRSAGALRAWAILFPGPRSFLGAGCFLLVPWGSFRGTNGYGDPAPGCCLGAAPILRGGWWRGRDGVVQDGCGRSGGWLSEGRCG